MKNKLSGFIIPVAVYVIVGVAAALTWGVYEVKTAFDPSKPTKQVDQLNAQAIAALAAAQTVQAQLLGDIQAHQDAIDAEKKKESNAAGFLSGAKSAYKSDPNPSPAFQIAFKFVNDASNSIDGATPDQVTYYQNMVAGLESQIESVKAKAQADLAAAEAVAQKNKSDAIIAQNLAAQKDDQLKIAASDNVAKDAQLKANTDSLRKWADDNQGLLTRIKHLTLGIIIILSVIFAIGWLLPLVGKAFPVFAPAAKLISAPFVLILHLLHEGEKKVLIATGAAATSAFTKAQGMYEAEKAAHAVTQANHATLMTAALTAAIPVAPQPSVAPVSTVAKPAGS